MTNKEKYNNIFKEVFNTEISNLNENFKQDSIDKWDSVQQMNLISLIEEAFDIMFEPEQIIDFSSYLRGIEILKEQGVEI